MEGDSMLVVAGNEVRKVLQGREQAVLEAVAGAYLAHREGKTSLPHSTFLRFPDNDRNRIIALPAYLGDGDGISGLKWIASYPENLELGLPRASAVLILNSSRTGRPRAILESSLISAARTAASAALAARALQPGGEAPRRVGLIGTGVINREIARYLRAVFPGLESALLFDPRRERAEAFGADLEATGGYAEVSLAGGVEEVLAACSLVAFATTATPHVESLAACPPGAVLLHISLRDLLPSAILQGDNVVDDLDHVCRASTSIHLTAEREGNRDFVRCTLADILAGAEPARSAAGEAPKPAIFSPFGLGILDLAVGRLVLEEAQKAGLGQPVADFFPE